MSAPYSIQNQNSNKCPHGFPIGTCPLCSGMGGAPKDRDKPRRAGEMSYNECMAAWIKIQAQQEAKLQAKIDKLEAMHQRTLENKIMSGVEKIQNAVKNFEANLQNSPALVRIPVQIALNVIVKPIINLIAKLPAMITNIKILTSNLIQMINSVSEKISSLLGELKNFIQEKITKKFKQITKTILSLFAQNSQEDEEREVVEKLKAREIKKIIKELFKIKKERNEHDNSKFAEKH